MKIGYARITFDEQNLDTQRQALKAAGCDIIFEDTDINILHEREMLNKAIEHCQSGDVLVIWKLDRVGRSLPDLVNIIEILNNRDVGLTVLTGTGTKINTTHPEGRGIFNILATLAEFERELISERTKLGMAAAKQRGVHLGRPAKLSAKDIQTAYRLIESGETRAKIAKKLGVDVVTLRRTLKSAASK